MLRWSESRVEMARESWREGRVEMDGACKTVREIV